jgi:hypothetical protein
LQYNEAPKAVYRVEYCIKEETIYGGSFLLDYEKDQQLDEEGLDAASGRCKRSSRPMALVAGMHHRTEKHSEIRKLQILPEQILDNPYTGLIGSLEYLILTPTKEPKPKNESPQCFCMPKSLSNGTPIDGMHFACPVNGDPQMHRLSPPNPFVALSPS